MNHPTYNEDGEPNINSIPPTPFELASLAIALMATGKAEDEAFKIARQVYERAEEELMDFEPLHARRMRGMLELMPDIGAQVAAQADRFHKCLGVNPPPEDDFPLIFEEFIHGILPQNTAKDRKHFFEDRILPVWGSGGKHAERIEDIHMWNLLLLEVATIRNWAEAARLKKDAASLLSTRRRSGKSYKLKRRRK